MTLYLNDTKNTIDYEIDHRSEDEYIKKLNSNTVMCTVLITVVLATLFFSDLRQHAVLELEVCGLWRFSMLA